MRKGFFASVSDFFSNLAPAPSAPKVLIKHGSNCSCGDCLERSKGFYTPWYGIKSVRR